VAHQPLPQVLPVEENEEPPLEGLLSGRPSATNSVRSIAAPSPRPSSLVRLLGPLFEVILAGRVFLRLFLFDELLVVGG
jgi:hypothetical protein